MKLGNSIRIFLEIRVIHHLCWMNHRFRGTNFIRVIPTNFSGTDTPYIRYEYSLSYIGVIKTKLAKEMLMCDDIRNPVGAKRGWWSACSLRLSIIGDGRNEWTEGVKNTRPNKPSVGRVD